MARTGRITIVSDFSPKDLLAVAREVAEDTRCRVGRLGDGRHGFHVRDAPGDPPVYTVLTLARMAADGLRVPLDVEVYADRDRAGDGWLTLDWAETGGSLRPRVCERFAESLADEIETRVEDDGGRVLSSESD